MLSAKTLRSIQKMYFFTIKQPNDLTTCRDITYNQVLVHEKSFGNAMSSAKTFRSIPKRYCFTTKQPDNMLIYYVQLSISKRGIVLHSNVISKNFEKYTKNVLFYNQTT